MRIPVIGMAGTKGPYDQAMNVLQVLPELNAGGVERTTMEVAEALVAAGHIPHVVSAGGRLVPELQELGAVHHTVHKPFKNPLFLSSHKRSFIQIIKNEKIDIVHARSRAPAWPARAAAQATGAHFITTYHGIYNARSGLKRRYNSVMAKGEIVIANSKYTKDHIISEHGLSPEKIQVIPRGVDMAVFDPDRVSDESLLQQKRDWTVKDGQFVVLLPGRLTRWKGQLVAVEALASLRENMVLVLMGDPQGRDDYVAEIQQKAALLSVAERVRIPGHSSDVPTALKAADIVISPSIEPEAFGRVVTEAQAMGRPVVASAHGGPLETVLEGQTGSLVQPGDPDVLASAVKSWLNHQAYDPFVARAHVQANFSKSRLQTDVLAVYQQILL